MTLRLTLCRRQADDLEAINEEISALTDTKGPGEQ